MQCYAPGKARSERAESERFHSFTYDELVARDKANLDITWLRDESLEDLDNLPAPKVIAREIVENLSAALLEFEAVAVALESSESRRWTRADRSNPNELEHGREDAGQRSDAIT